MDDVELDNIKTIPFSSGNQLIMGDLWPNSIVINPDDGLVWLLDWEMCRIGHGFEDITQCCANFFLMKHKPKIYNINRVNEFEQQYIQEFCTVSNYYPSVVDEMRFLIFTIWLAGYPHWDFLDPESIIKASIKASPGYFKMA